MTPTGRAIYNALFNPVKLDVSEMFLPRRTAFVYDLDEEFSPSDIPTMLRRSKADCPQVGPRVAQPHALPNLLLLTCHALFCCEHPGQTELHRRCIGLSFITRYQSED